VDVYKHNDGEHLTQTCVKFVIMQKMVTHKQITVITEEKKSAETENMQKEKQDLILLPAIICFSLIKVIMGICRIFSF